MVHDRWPVRRGPVSDEAGVFMEHAEGGLPAEVDSSLRRLAAVVRDAGRTSELEDVAAALGETQRVAAWGLRSVVRLGRERGLTWRELADALGVPVSTLHRQYSRGEAIVGALDAAPSASSAPFAADPAVAGPPAVLDRFVGRREELARVPELLARRRWVSLVGPAGVGKTRLAAELLRPLRAAFPGGLWWVDLAPITRGWLIRTAVGDAAGGASDGRDLLRIVEEATAADAVLLVLDNCEHLLGATAALVTELLAAAPPMSALTTSREAMRAPGEVVLPVAPLPPARGQGTTPRLADAVRLFAERARDVRPDFDIDDWTDAVAELCDRLDGLPLAIELAAHLSDILPPDRMLARLPERLDLLAGARRGPGRHDSLRDAIVHSYELLGEDGRKAFARLCVLPGGFDERGAAAVMGDLAAGPAGVFRTLAELTRKSMIYSDPVRPGRFRILDSLRAFGLEALAATGELAGTQVRVIEWLVDLEQRLETGSLGRELGEVAHRVAVEAENLRYAVETAAESGHPHHPRLALALARHHINRLELAEVDRLLVDVLDSPRTPVADQVTAASLLAVNRLRLGDHETAGSLADRAFELAGPLDDIDAAASSLTSVMLARGLNGDLAVGAELGPRLVALVRGAGRTDLLGRALNNYAWMLVASGDAGRAREAVSEAIEIYEAGADQSLPLAGRFASHLGMCMLDTAAVVAIIEGRDATAAEYTTAVLSCSFYHHNTIVSALDCAAILAVRRGDHVLALTLLAGTQKLERTINRFWARQLETASTLARAGAGAAAARAAGSAGRSMDIAALRQLALRGELPQRDSLLTPREREVVRHVAAGLTNGQIAVAMSIGERTVASHLEHIRTRLDLHTRVELALWASRSEAVPQWND